jgi:hypothetical protein
MTKFHIREWRSGQILHAVEIAKETPLHAPDLRGISLENAMLNGADLRSANNVPQASADQWLDEPSPKPRHPSGTTRLDPLSRGEHMNPIAKAILRVVAVTAGTAYFLSTFYLVVSVPELTTTQMVIGWYGTALGQMLIGLILAGIGLGVVSIRFGKEK